MKKLWKNIEFKERKIKGAPFKKGRIPWNKNKLCTESTKEKLRIAAKEQWKDPEYRKFMARPERTRNCLQRRIPSSLEEKFLAITKKHDLPYKYTGDGSFVIGHCNPDFVNTNNEKIAIEVYAKYFKEINGRNILRWKHIRRQKFAKFGWQIIFFDETQVKEEFVLTTLREKIS